MDTPLSEISRTEYIHSEENLLAALRKYRGLRSYPTATDRGQVALHAALEQLATKGLARRKGTDGPTVLWQSTV